MTIRVLVTITEGKKVIADASVETHVNWLNGPHDLVQILSSQLTTKVRNWLIIEIEKDRETNIRIGKI